MAKLISIIYAAILVLGLAGPNPQDRIDMADPPASASQSKANNDWTLFSPVRCTSKYRYSANGKALKIFDHAYDKKNNIHYYKYYDYKEELTSTTEERYNQDGNLIRKVKNDGDQSSTILWEYDENGNEIRESLYAPDGTIQNQHTYEYDRNGNRIRHIYSGENVDKPSMLEYVYDDDGNHIKTIHYNSDGNIIETTEYEYDANGNTQRYVDYAADGNIAYITEYEYDDRNHTKRIRYDADGRRCFEIEYDKDGHTLRNVIYGSDGTILFRTEYEYDDHGNKISYIYCVHEQLIDHFTYQYDQKGRMILSKCYYSSGELCYTQKMAYDTDGNTISIKRYNSLGELILSEECIHYWTIPLVFLAQ